MYMISSNLLLLFNINYIKSWIYSNLMEIGFYSNKRKIGMEESPVFLRVRFSDSVRFLGYKTGLSPDSLMDYFCQLSEEKRIFKIGQNLSDLEANTIPSRTIVDLTIFSYFSLLVQLFLKVDCLLQGKLCLLNK